MNIFVTGGSGFLGRRLIERLIQDGYFVHALVRSEKSGTLVRKLGATLVHGDMNDIQEFAEGLNGMDVVIHCASPMDFWGPWVKFEKEIVGSSINFAKECELRNVGRFIYISSESVLQGEADLIDIDETYPYPREPNSFYGLAKKRTEEGLLGPPTKMEIVILRPTFIWGPNCPALLSISQKVKKGEFIWINQGRKNFEAIHLDNLVEAISLALTRGKTKTVYIVTDDEASSVRDFFTPLFAAMKLPAVKYSMPGFILRPLAGILEIIWKALSLRSPPPLTRFELAFVGMGRKYNISRIKNDLGYKPAVSRKDGFAQIAAFQNAIDRG